MVPTYQAGVCWQCVCLAGFSAPSGSQQPAESVAEALPPLGTLHAGAAAAFPSGLPIIHQRDIHLLKHREFAAVQHKPSWLLIVEFLMNWNHHLLCKIIFHSGFLWDAVFSSMSACCPSVALVCWNLGIYIYLQECLQFLEIRTHRQMASTQRRSHHPFWPGFNKAALSKGDLPFPVEIDTYPLSSQFLYRLRLELFFDFLP